MRRIAIILAIIMAVACAIFTLVLVDDVPSVDAPVTTLHAPVVASPVATPHEPATTSAELAPEARDGARLTRMLTKKTDATRQTTHVNNSDLIDSAAQSKSVAGMILNLPIRGLELLGSAVLKLVGNKPENETAFMHKDYGSERVRQEVIDGYWEKQGK